MDLDQVVDELGIADSREVLAAEWETSQEARPDGKLDFLSPAFVTDACRGTYLPDEIAEAAVASARRVAERPALCALAWHCHWCLYHCPDYPTRNPARWPAVEGALQDAAGPFYLLVLLGWFPNMQALNREHGVPEQVVRDSMDQMLRRCFWYKRRFGRWGLAASVVRWLSNYFRGEIYVVVRLAYQFRKFGDRIRVYRHVGSRKVVALSEDGVSYRTDGQLCLEGDEDAGGEWTSRLVVADREVIGNPILPTGRAVETEVRLPTGEWEQALGPGDAALGVHIPGEKPLDHAQCGEAFRTAVAFYSRHFPEWRFKAFHCGSWLLDTQLEQFLPPTANLVRFLREFYLCPGGLSPDSLLRAVLGKVPDDLSQAPRRTSLQRAIVDHMAKGGRMAPGAGRCFLLPEDLDWGGQVYRKVKFPWDLVGED